MTDKDGKKRTPENHFGLPKPEDPELEKKIMLAAEHVVQTMLPGFGRLIFTAMEIDSLQSEKRHYIELTQRLESEIRGWKHECAQKDKKIADFEAKIARLERDLDAERVANTLQKAPGP